MGRSLLPKSHILSETDLRQSRAFFVCRSIPHLALLRMVAPVVAAICISCTCQAALTTLEQDAVEGLLLFNQEIGKGYIYEK